MREIASMVTDLEAAMKLHAAKAVEATRKTAETMAAVAEQHSSPMYGVVVDARATHDGTKSTVRVRIWDTYTGIGKVVNGSNYDVIKHHGAVNDLRALVQSFSPQ